MRHCSAWLISALAMLASCSIGTEATPRDVPVGERVELRLDADLPAGAAVGTARVYLVSPESSGQARTLEPVARDVTETSRSVLQALLDGPNSVELDARLRSAIPDGLTLLATRLQGETLQIDLSNELRQRSGDELITAVAQIVLTATELRNVSSVQILINGDSQQWPAGNGELQADPLTRYDYPGIALSTQPDYPAIPSPAQP